jgi:hypothetical protein
MPKLGFFFETLYCCEFKNNYFIMSNRFSDALFQLIRSLQKAEKRNFKLYIKRSSSNQDLKIIRLFDALDKLQEYDEKQLLKKLPGTKKPQLSNLKAHLYKEVMASLRLLKISESIDLQLHEQLDYARILYNRGLYLQSLKVLEKAKEMALTYNQDSFLIQVISLEKKIETLHITRSINNRPGQLTNEALEINERRTNITNLSNLALKMYSWYVKNGHARNIEDEKRVKKYFDENLPPDAWSFTGFYERLYLFQSLCWYTFICQDFLMYYRYAQKWILLFQQNEIMINVEPGHYIKGLHNLLNAHFVLRNYRQFEKTLVYFERFASSEIVTHHENFKVQTFTYLYTAKVNQHFMHGTFKEGLKLIPHIENMLHEYELYLDKHRVLVFNYKIATLYFGDGDYNTCIDYLHRIMNNTVDLRYDIQCYARLLHLMCHYELDNFDIIEPLIKSVNRFMKKMETLTVMDEEIFKFLRTSFSTDKRKRKERLEKFLQRIHQLQKNRFETRAFAYLDIISWVESKVYEKPMSEIIHEKFLKSRRSKRM